MLFFLLSSYLITTLLLREFEQTGRLDLVAFYIRRALRIWPLYFVAVAVSILLLPHFGFQHIPVAHVVGMLTFTFNWSQAALGYARTPASLLWSVSVEEQFYFVWPLLLVALGVHDCRG